MAFKFINPGYGKLIDSAFHTIQSTVYNPKFAVSFWFERGYGANKGYTIPALGYSGMLFFKFDVYFPTDDFNSLYFGIGDTDYHRVHIYIGKNDYSHYLRLYDSYGNVAISVSSDNYGDFLKFDAVNTIWGKIRLEDEFDEDGACSIKINGTTIGEASNLVTSAQNQTIFVINNSIKTPISNFILSDEEIHPDENIFRASPAYGISTTFMTQKNGLFQRTFLNTNWNVPVERGDVSLQNLKLKNLYDAVGADGKVLTMAAVLCPAFYTGSEVAAQYFDDTQYSNANCFVVSGAGDDYKQTNYPAQNISSDTSAALIQYLPVDSDTTFASLNGLNIGWNIDLGSV